jgi:hypothetical protein
MNWQNGVVGDHVVLAGTAPGVWTINGVRAHQIETDHSGSQDNGISVNSTSLFLAALTRQPRHVA